MGWVELRVWLKGVKNRVGGKLVLTTNTLEMGDEKSQNAMERMHFIKCGLPAFINCNGSLLHNASDFKGFSEKMN